MWPKLFDRGQVGSIFLLLGSGQVSHLWFESGIGKFPLKVPNFSILPFGSKKISSGWVKKYPGQRRIGVLFTAGQKYAQAGLGQGPSLAWLHFVYLILIHHLPKIYWVEGSSSFEYDFTWRKGQTERLSNFYPLI